MKILGKEVGDKWPEHYHSNFIQKCTKWDENKIKAAYPKFYDEFRNDIESGVITIYDDYPATGCGVAVNFNTGDVLMIDFRN